MERRGGGGGSGGKWKPRKGKPAGALMPHQHAVPQRGLGEPLRKQARHYSELAAMDGHAIARSNLGIMEEESGNVDKAIKHYLISVEGGNKQALEIIKDLYMIGRATKDEYAIALRMYQTYLDELKSGQRDEAAAFNTDWKYLY